VTLENWRQQLEAFDLWAATYDDDVLQPDFYYEESFAFVSRVLESRLKSLSGKRIADLGSGTGNYAARLRALGCDVVGVEPSAGMRRRAAEKWPDLPVLAGDLLAIPLEDGWVEAAITTFAVSHLSHAEKVEAFREVHRVVRSGGILVVVDVGFNGEPDLTRVESVLESEGKRQQIPYYRAAYAIDVPRLVHGVARLWTAVESRQISALVWGLAFARLAS
jgi:putative AdoMet-dependent methyltransferase